jgi:hypothetical protein
LASIEEPVHRLISENITIPTKLSADLRTSSAELSKRLARENLHRKVLFLRPVISVIRQGIAGKEVAFLQNRSHR